MLAMLDTPLAAVLAGRLQEERGRDPRHRARPRLQEHLRHLVPRRRRHRHHRQQRDGHQRPPHHRVCRHVSPWCLVTTAASIFPCSHTSETEGGVVTVTMWTGPLTRADCAAPLVPAPVPPPPPLYPAPGHHHHHTAVTGETSPVQADTREWTSKNRQENMKLALQECDVNTTPLTRVLGGTTAQCIYSSVQSVATWANTAAWSCTVHCTTAGAGPANSKYFRVHWNIFTLKYLAVILMHLSDNAANTQYTTAHCTAHLS